jgi:hypothetical protein
MKIINISIKTILIFLLLNILIDNIFCKKEFANMKLNKGKNLLKSHVKKIKLKNKKCNPYKNGPATYNSIEYIDPSKAAHGGGVFGGNRLQRRNPYESKVKHQNIKVEKKQETYYPNNNDIDRYVEEFGLTKNTEQQELITPQPTPKAISANVYYPKNAYNSPQNEEYEEITHTNDENINEYNKNYKEDPDNTYFYNGKHTKNSGDRLREQGLPDVNRGVEIEVSSEQ